MKVLLVSSGWLTHLLPMKPFGHALRAAGHEVWLAVPPALMADAVGTGLPVRPVGHDVDYETVFGNVLRAPRPPAGGPAPAPPKRPRVLRLFAEGAARMLDDLRIQLRVGKFDAVVYEPMAIAAPIAAASAGIPAIRFRFGPDVLSRHLDGVFEEMLDVCARFGVRVTKRPIDEGGRLLAGNRTIDPTPDALRATPDEPDVWPIRYAPAWPGLNGFPATTPRHRPSIAVSWGSTLFRCAPPAYLAGDVARALADIAGEVLVVAHGAEADAVGELPAHARLLADVPLQQVVSRCDLVVSHGGAGTILTTALAGRPHLTVPRLPDHRFHSARLAESGAGRALPLTAPIGPLAPADADRIVAAAKELLDDPATRRAAEDLSIAMDRAPDPSAVAGQLAELVAVGTWRAR